MQYNIYSNKERLQYKVGILPISEWGGGWQKFFEGFFLLKVPHITYRFQKKVLKILTFRGPGGGWIRTQAQVGKFHFFWRLS